MLRRQEFARPLRVGHVEESPKRVRRQIRRHLTRDETRVGQEAQVPRHRILLEVMDPLAQRAQGDSER
jgi:hypothetical protein